MFTLAKSQFDIELRNCRKETRRREEERKEEGHYAHPLFLKNIFIVNLQETPCKLTECTLNANHLLQGLSRRLSPSSIQSVTTKENVVKCLFKHFGTFGTFDEVIESSKIKHGLNGLIGLNCCWIV